MDESISIVIDYYALLEWMKMQAKSTFIYMSDTISISTYMYTIVHYNATISLYMLNL